MPRSSHPSIIHSHENYDGDPVFYSPILQSRDLSGIAIYMKVFIIILQITFSTHMLLTDTTKTLESDGAVVMGMEI